MGEDDSSSRPRSISNQFTNLFSRSPPSSFSSSSFSSTNSNKRYSIGPIVDASRRASTGSSDESAVDEVNEIDSRESPIGRRLSQNAKSLMTSVRQTTPAHRVPSNSVKYPGAPGSPPLSASTKSSDMTSVPPVDADASAAVVGGGGHKGIFARARRASLQSVQRPPTPTGERMLAGNISFD